jgi:hypothetical protein
MFIDHRMTIWRIDVKKSKRDDEQNMEINMNLMVESIDENKKGIYITTVREC